MTDGCPVTYSLKMSTDRLTATLELISEVEITTDFFIDSLRILADEIEAEQEQTKEEMN